MNHTIMTKLFAIPVAVASIVMAYACSASDPSVVAVQPIQEVVLDPVVTTTSTTTPPPVPTTTLPDLSGVDWVGLARNQYGKCGEWRQLALAVGWPAEEWKTLSYVLHRESRCNIDSWNKTDTNGGSRGLMQVNGYWCKPNRWSPAGWLQDRGILKTCEDLFLPEVNLRAGLAIWMYGEAKHGCGWRGPWATPCGKFG